MNRRLTLTTGIVLMSLSLLYLGANAYRARAPLKVDDLGGLHAPILGPADAPTTVTIFTDYRCPHCRAFEREVMPRLKQLAKDGEVRLAVAPIAMLGEDSTLLARAALCAARQGEVAFTALQGELYEFPGVNQRVVLELAQRVEGVSLSGFRTCLQRRRTAGEVEANTEIAREIGIRGTPTVVVENKGYANPNWEKLQDVLEGGL